MVYLVGDLENAKAFMLMKYGTKNFYDSSFNLTANKHLAPCYPLDGRNLYKVVKLDEDFLNDLVILLVPFTHIASMTEEQRSKLNNLIMAYKEWESLDSYQASLVVDRMLSSSRVSTDRSLKSIQKEVSGYLYGSEDKYILHTIQEQKTTGVYVPKTVATRSNISAIQRQKPKPKNEYVKQCNYSELSKLINNPSNYKQVTGVEGTYFSGFDGSPYKLSIFLTKYFGSEYWNSPVSGYRIEYDGKFYAGSVSIDVTGLSTSVLVNGYHSMREDWSKFSYKGIEKKIGDCYSLYSNTIFSVTDAIPLKYTPLTLLNFQNDLKFTDEGIFLEVGLVKLLSDIDGAFINFAWIGMYANDLVESMGTSHSKFIPYKKDTRYAIQEWKSTHQKVVERAKYGESEWLHRDLSEIVIPQPNTKIIYVCYLPETGVIKVGRTRNWGSRKGVYSRFKGDSKLTSGIMRLCYYWNVISTGDEVVDRFLMYCAEDHLKLLANHRMCVVEGKEFFKGYDLNDFIREVRSYLESLSVSRLISIRDTSKIKRFCSGESYDYDRLMQRLQELKENKIT